MFGASALVRNPRAASGVLDVSHSKEVYGALSVDRIEASNPTEYAFNPLTFTSRFDGRFVTGAVRLNAGSQVFGEGGAAWRGVVGAGETLHIILIFQGKGVSDDLNNQFEGTYSVIGRRGLLENRPVAVLPHQQVVLARLIRVLWFVGGGVVVICLSSLTVWWWRRRTSSASLGASSGG